MTSMTAIEPPRVQAKPVLISMGDAAGVGPEIICLAMKRHPEWLNQVVVAGDLRHMQRAAAVTGLSCALQVAPSLDSVMDMPQQGLRVWQCVDSPSGLVEWGRVHLQAGAMAIQAIEASARAVMAAQGAALVTAPVHKEALALAGCLYPGHTELLQALAAEHLGCPVCELPVRMMLSNTKLKTVLLSIHVSLREALDRVTQEGLRQTLEITRKHFERLGLPNIRIAVAGLNPHAGEGGLFGTEDLQIIKPVVDTLAAQGQLVAGPFSPDTVFWRAMQGEFDVVLAMYHDQGLIPVKLFGLEHGVNTTLGLPLIRTSPDHGTAFDRAGTGTASPESLEAAIIEAMAAAGIKQALIS